MRPIEMDLPPIRHKSKEGNGLDIPACLRHLWHLAVPDGPQMSEHNLPESRLQ